MEQEDEEEHVCIDREIDGLKERKYVYGKLHFVLCTFLLPFLLQP